MNIENPFKSLEPFWRMFSPNFASRNLISTSPLTVMSFSDETQLNSEQKLMGKLMQLLTSGWSGTPITSQQSVSINTKPTSPPNPAPASQSTSNKLSPEQLVMELMEYFSKKADKTPIATTLAPTTVESTTAVPDTASDKPQIPKELLDMIEKYFASHQKSGEN